MSKNMHHFHDTPSSETFRLVLHCETPGSHGGECEDDWLSSELLRVVW
jgi:hypothetical protein